MGKSSTIILRVDEDTRGYIEERANKMGIGLSECVREIIESNRALEDIENETGDARKFLTDLSEKIIWGEVEIENGVLKAFTGE